MNYIKPNGKSLCSEWYCYVGDFIDGLARVRRDNGDYNFIKQDGYVLYGKWLKYHYVFYFKNGFARVQRDDLKWNFIKLNGDVLCDEWYKTVSDFKKGVAKARRYDGQICYIDTKGEIVG